MQVLCVPTRYVGYKKETGAGNPEWDAPVTFRAFLNSTVITCGARYLPYEHVMPMSEKRVVFSNEDHTVEMVLGSDSRRTIFWTMPFEPFAKVLCRGAVDKDGDLCWLHFVDKVKLEKGQWEELLQEFPLAVEERKAIRTICGKPRDGVFSIAAWEAQRSRFHINRKAARRRCSALLMPESLLKTGRSRCGI